MIHTLPTDLVRFNLYNNIRIMALSAKDMLSSSKIKDLVKTVQPRSASVSDMISQEEAQASQMSKDKLMQYFSDRSKIRQSMLNWSLKTWRPAEDAFNVRTSKLIDLYLDNASKKVNENWQPKFTSEQIIAASKDLPKTLNSMKQYYQYYEPDKVWAIDDYIQKWWIATNVFQYLDWRANNPYWVQEQEHITLWDENTPEAAKWVISAGMFIPNMWIKAAWWLSNTKLWKWMNEVAYNSDHKIWDSASEEEYRKYKSWELWEGSKIDNMSIWGVTKRQLYEWYDKALSEWFVGSLDDYKNFDKNVTMATNEAVWNAAKEWAISKEDLESSKWALIWNAISEFITYMAMPLAKAVEIDTARPLLNLFATAWVDSIVNTLEYAMLEGAQWNLEKGDVWEVWLINFLISWILRSPALAKYIKEAKNVWGSDNKFVRKFLSTLPEKVENAFKNMSSDTLESLWNMAREEASNPEAQWTIRKWLWWKWVTAIENIQKDITNLWQRYEKRLQELTSPVSEKWFFSDVNKSLKELENQWWLSRWKWKAPQLDLVKTNEWYKVEIKNKWNLNKIKNEEWVWLWDAIAKNVEDILWWYKIWLNEWSQYLIKQWVINATKWTKWNVYEQQTKRLIEWLDNWDLDMAQDVKDLWTEIYQKKNLLSRAQKTFWIEWKYSAWKVGAWDRALEMSKAWKNMNNEDAIAMIDLLKQEWYLPQNIKSEIAAQWYLLWIENKNAWYSFLEGFYPSQAWEIEQVLELLRQKATAKDIERYIRLLRAKEQWAVSAWAVANIPNMNDDIWREIQKWIWWWVNVIREASEISTWDNQTPMQDFWEDYDAWYSQRYNKNL